LYVLKVIALPQPQYTKLASGFLIFVLGFDRGDLPFFSCAALNSSSEMMAGCFPS
jgi:hypothetical protein